MNRLITFLAVMMLGFTAGNAQIVTQGSIEAISNDATATVDFDLTRAMVKGQSLEEYIEILSLTKGPHYDERFEFEMRDILGQFINEFNDVNGQIFMTVSDKPTLHMTIAIKQLSPKGNVADCDYVFWKYGIDDPLCVISMNIKEGRFGSFTNLLGDVFRESGEKLAKYLKKQIKAVRKKQKKNNSYNDI